MRSYKRMRAVAAVAAVTMLATACGGDGEDQPDEAGGGGTQTEGGGEGESGELTLGYVLPETGPLAFLGPPQIEAVGYAIQQINDAGGVLGTPVPEVVAGDEAGDQAIASQSASRVLGQDVDAIIGAASSAMSLAIIDQVTDAGVVQCSGSNTAPTFTDYDDGGYYIRTAPSDALQGPILADTIISDGYSNVAIVALADDYGQGLAQATAEALETAGATVVHNESFDPNATDFGSVVQGVVSSNPDAVLVIAFEQGTQIIQGLIEAGLSPGEGVGFYGADGLRVADLPNLIDSSNPGVLAGMKGTAPASAENEDFITGIQEYAPDLAELQFAPQVYDCVITIALAAEAAGSTNAEDFQPLLVDVTREGEPCTSFEECKALLEEGADIDYNGVSGPLDFTDVGEPGVASIEVYGYNESGELETLDVRESTLAE